MEISKLKPNKNNPRKISEQKLEQLKKSINDFEKMLEARPIIVNKDFKILGGNMRYTALLALGYESIPDNWVKVVDFTKDQEKEFIIKDNVGFGDWDWDMLHIEWNADRLEDWGINLPNWANNEQEDEIDLSSFNKSAESYLNNTIRQIVLQYDNETHKAVIEKLSQISIEFNCKEDNSETVLNLIKYYEENRM